MTTLSLRPCLPSSTAPVLAAGLAAGAFGLVAFSPFGAALAEVFVESWLAAYMDAQVFRLVCF